MPLPPSRILSVAPMLDWTNRHCRYFLRLISRHILLYTEMVTTGAILHGNFHQHLRFNELEHPLAIQLGGSEPKDLAQAGKIAAEYGYDEINLNVGCPSNRVQQGRFGACLMAEPELVSNCIAAMKAVVDIPVTVKTRIGIDHHDSYEHLSHFISTVAAAGCETFIIHARKAWLQGLSPKENREIPPLRYDIAQQLVVDFPRLKIVLNGGVQSLTQAAEHLRCFSGVMLGRAVLQDPYLLSEADQRFYGASTSIPSRHDVLNEYVIYMAQQIALGVPLSILTKHILSLFYGLPGAKNWRRYLSEHLHLSEAGVKTIEIAAKLVYSLTE